MSQNSESLFEFDMSNLDDLDLDDDLDDVDFNMDLEKVSPRLSSTNSVNFFVQELSLDDDDTFGDIDTQKSIDQSDEPTVDDSQPVFDLTEMYSTQETNTQPNSQNQKWDPNVTPENVFFTPEQPHVKTVSFRSPVEVDSPRLFYLFNLN